MIPLLAGTIAIGAAAIGWVGYKAYARITAWGNRMNEVDEIFRHAAEDENQAVATVVHARPVDSRRANATFTGQHLPTR